MIAMFFGSQTMQLLPLSMTIVAFLIATSPAVVQGFIVTSKPPLYHEARVNPIIGITSDQQSLLSTTARFSMHDGILGGTINISNGDDAENLDYFFSSLQIPILIIGAAVLGISIQTFIGSMLEGEQGLGGRYGTIPYHTTIAYHT